MAANALPLLHRLSRIPPSLHWQKACHCQIGRSPLLCEHTARTTTQLRPGLKWTSHKGSWCGHWSGPLPQASLFLQCISYVSTEQAKTKITYVAPVITSIAPTAVWSSKMRSLGLVDLIPTGGALRGGGPLFCWQGWQLLILVASHDCKLVPESQ